MAEDRIDPREQIREAELLEQQTQLEAQSLTDAKTVSAIHDTPSDAVEEADLLEQHAPLLGDDERLPTPSRRGQVVMMADPLVEVAVRVHADYAEHATLPEVLAVIAQCRTDLETPSAAAVPELLERLARQRLADLIEQPAPATR